MDNPKIDIQTITDMGFVPDPNFNVMKAYTYDLGRRRSLSIGSIGTPNEMVFLSEHENGKPYIVTDIICIYNYDYDGYLTKEKLQNFINCFKNG